MGTSGSKSMIAALRQTAASKGLGAALAGLESLRTPPPASRGAEAKRERLEGNEPAASYSGKEYMTRLEEKIKSHYRKPLNDQSPPYAVIIPPLTTDQYVAVKNWNAVAQVGVYGVTAMAGALIGVVTRNPLVGAIGALAGVMWGAYESNCIASLQDEFDEAFKRGSGVTVWREGWKFNVDGNRVDGMYTQANAPLSALYVAATTWLLTGKVP
jgi:hypothetical protein